MCVCTRQAGFLHRRKRDEWGVGEREARQLTLSSSSIIFFMGDPRKRQKILVQHKDDEGTKIFLVFLTFDRESERSK